MKAIALTFLLLKVVKPVSHWFNIGNVGDGYSTVAGPNREYIIRGNSKKIYRATIDLVNGQAFNLPIIDLSSEQFVTGPIREGST